MNETLVASALAMLDIVRQSTEAIGVAVSFGKDSLVTLDLCCQIFPRVEAYYLYRVRGLSVVEEWAADVKKRHGVTVRMYPHFDLVRCYANAVLRPHDVEVKAVPKVKFTDIENAFRVEANVAWLAMGWRRSDSLSRALIMKGCGGIDFKAHRVFPLRFWKNTDVYDYLDTRGIPRPPTLGRREQGGLDFNAGALAALKERPEDWAKWLRDFPFSEAHLGVPMADTRRRGGRGTKSAVPASEAPTAASPAAPRTTGHTDRRGRRRSRP
jgi:phosphoadenosine phosphosulfate reductase